MKTCCYLLFVALLSACAGVPVVDGDGDAPFPSGDVKIISYNVYNGFNYHKSEDLLIEWVREQAPAVIAFQELNRTNSDELAAMAAQWGHDHVAMLKHRGYPIGLASINEIEVVERRVDDMAHGFLHARTGGIHFFVVHLNPHDYRERWREAHMILDKVKPVLEHGEPVIVLGDFNANSRADRASLEPKQALRSGRKRNLNEGDIDFSVMDLFLQDGLVDSVQKLGTEGASETYPTRLFENTRSDQDQQRLLERIDYILLDEHLAERARRVDVPRDGVVHRISDHYPVILELELELDAP